MRGPHDSAIEATQAPVETAGAAAMAGAEERRPPGSKALLRLLHLLERRGYTETAAAAVDAAVSDEQKEEFRVRAAQFTAAPRREPPEGGRRTRKSRESTAEPVAGETPAEEISNEYLAVGQHLAGPPSPTGPQWRSLGPYTIPNGQTYGSSRVNVSGRVAAIAVDPRDPAHVLCGAANGGVWESHDRGASWAPRTDYQATLAVGAIAFDPRNPATVYCGTGEGNWWAFLGAGILRSTNGGASWSTLCTAPFVGQGFYDLLVDPADSNHLLAATTNGLYVSTNAGVNWTQRRSARTWSISMAPAGGPGAEILAASSDGLWVSTNGGTTWSAVALPGSPGAFDRLAVSIARSNPSVAYTWGARGATAYLWRRAGGAWTAQMLPPGVSTGQAWYDWYCAAAPDRDTEVYLGAIESYRGDLSGGVWTWLTISNKGASGDSIHPDQHAIAFEPGNPNMIYVGCDGGLYRSPNRGVNWQHCNNGLVISEFEYLAQNVGSSRWIVGGTQDNGTDRWTGSAIWDHVADGDGGDCGVNRSNPLTVFHTYYNMSPERSTTGGNFGSWTYIPPPIPAGEGSLFYPPFECSASGGDTIAIGGDAVYVSRNNGAAWTRLAFPSAARSSAMYIPNADNLYVGTTDGRIFHTKWNGASWPALTALTTPRANAYVSDLFVDPNNLNRMWATYSPTGGGRVYRSDNGGGAWIDRTAGLPNLPINAIEVDSRNVNRVWVAADLGVYQSWDAGATWADFSNALPNCFIGDLVFHPHAWVLRAGTRNRGVWEIPVDGWMTVPVCGVQWTGSLNANQTQRWFTFNWPATWHVIWTVMPTSPNPGAPQVTWTVQVERASAEFATYWITVQNLTAVPVTFEGRYCILSRY
jgi:hypothetical protein